MSDHREPHNGRDLHGRLGVPKADVEELLEDPRGADIVREEVRSAGAVADVGPHAAEPARHIAELIEENREDVGRVTGRTRKDARK
ncbi:MAG: hypothetical protein JWM41_1313 [Gemmatimonadetes bacterium]|nr:hypothetical protein [Gemmatimonadota bacterium]